ncbi:hypothetical protein XI09_05245 [Bradyrhizobium sp. CCBAU 11386]|uniref:hypothetical protein n=1 Tax=Bradyrhizobium sp. CCBAU 11386 TaxID=1630837 RepID=UPI00230414E6|nr:hypothetical protein [Bradyrhizobium sp. CCBAU 11386]MDA9504177.1 hypothetical protein [Bradyrhizobium sp. CCBAU 11386]
MDEKHDRRAAVIQSRSYNGIDFVEIVDDAQTTLRVHFLNDVPLQGTITGQPTIKGGETIRKVPVLHIDDASDWGFDENHLTLTLRVHAPGDFSTYRLAIPSRKLDSYFTEVEFSFKAACPSDLDCEVPPRPCPPPDGDAPPINYLAKDFLSFRQALLDFSALRYPTWQERSEADFGVMFLEALSALADDFSYMQDRIATEATLITATQRRSVMRHARLVDYEPMAATGSTVMLRFDVASGVDHIPAGVEVMAPSPDGTPIPFETGTGLKDSLLDPNTGALLDKPPSVQASELWNGGKIEPYWFDDRERCLKAGATSMYVLGHGYEFHRDQLLLIETMAETTADPPLRQIVKLESSSELRDPIFMRPADGAGPPFMTCAMSPPQPLAPTAVTQIVWRQADKLAKDRDLTRTHVAGNITPATQGRTVSDEAFVIGPPAAGGGARGTVTRTGPRPLLPKVQSGVPPPVHLYTLDQAPLTWLAQNATDPPAPEIVLQQQDGGDTPIIWRYCRSLLEAGAYDTAFTVDPAAYRQIARNSDDSLQFDYDGDRGDTLRFGDGSFGFNPDPGTRFTVSYRTSAGVAGNVAAEAISQLGAKALSQGNLLAVSNPLPASGGRDAETLQTIRRLAPQAFQAKQFRAVTLSDYRMTAETLPWVQRAGAASRWTGSWLTNFTTPDPKASEQITTDQRIDLVTLLNRYRMAGTESYVDDPDYLSLDLDIHVCARPDAFAGDVKRRLIAALSPAGSVGNTAGFFAPDNFSFGQPLERSALEAAIQQVPGVAGVLCVHYRVRGRSAGLAEMGDVVPVGVDQIIRCDNDPSSPERGAFSLLVEGGR